MLLLLYRMTYYEENYELVWRLCRFSNTVVLEGHIQVTSAHSIGEDGSSLSIVFTLNREEFSIIIYMKPVSKYIFI